MDGTTLLRPCSLPQLRTRWSSAALFLSLAMKEASGVAVRVVAAGARSATVGRICNKTVSIGNVLTHTSVWLVPPCVLTYLPGIRKHSESWSAAVVKQVRVVLRALALLQPRKRHYSRIGARPLFYRTSVRCVFLQ